VLPGRYQPQPHDHNMLAPIRHTGYLTGIMTGKKGRMPTVPSTEATILITGANGMLGRTLMQGNGQHCLVGTSRADADLTDGAAVQALVARVRPAVVVHGAAMTKVDLCEQERERAFAENACSARHIAMACHAQGAHLIAISTDYVFAGDADRPYHEQDPTAPRTVYGASKLAGELAIAECCPRHTILRTAWLYGAGGPSFVHTMLKLGRDPGPALKVVDDQRGNPTSTNALAELIWRLVDQPLSGIVHASCEGETTWYGFAQEIFRIGGLARPLAPCTTAEFPRPAPRPTNSRLDKRALRNAGRPAMPHWQDALQRFLASAPPGDTRVPAAG
jgi:dTDP-4-dehydrorhamnose reductase